MDPQLLGNLGHALVMGRPLPPADISPLLRRSLRLDTLAVTTHRSVPPGEPRLLLKTNAASHLAIGKHLEEADQHACLVANGQANAKQLFLRTKPEIAMACQCSWDRPFMVHGSWILTLQTLSLARDHFIRPRHRLGQPRRVRISTIVIKGPQFVTPG